MEHSPVRLLGPVRLEAIALVAGGALVVHDGRFAAADGARWQDALTETGHAYLSLLLPLVALGLGAAIWLVARDAFARRGAGHERPSFARTWAVVTLVLVAVYAGQELTEGVLSAEHQTGIAGVVDEGGWSAFLLAPVVAALIAALLCGARAAVAAPAPMVALRDAMASHLAGRGPPATG